MVPSLHAAAAPAALPRPDPAGSAGRPDDSPRARLLPADPAAPAAHLAPWAALWHKAHAYATHAGQRQYLRNNAAIAAGCVGAGVNSSGFLVLLAALGRRDSAIPVVAMVSITALQTATTTAGTIWASHRREQLLHGAPGAGAVALPPPPRALCWTLVACGAADALQSGCLLAITWGLGTRLLPLPLVLAVGVVARVVEASVAGVAQGTWAALRVHVGGRGQGSTHPILSATATAMENLVHGLSFNLAAIGGLLGSTAGQRSEGWLLQRAAGLMAAGTAVSSLSKLSFLLQARRDRDGDGDGDGDGEEPAAVAP